MIIGIDSLDSNLISKFENDLPNFRKLKEESPRIKSESVFPPDSDTAWASIYTGLNPAKHGIVEFVDPIEKMSILQTQEIDINYLKRKTFFDYASASGKKVCILLPHICYPPWDVNGVMVSRSRIKGDVQATPANISEKYDLTKLSNLTDMPNRNEKTLKSMINAYNSLVLNETRFFAEMMKESDWDLLFFYSSAADTIQHCFWNYCDENDPEYPADNPFKDVILNFYKLYDNVIGKLISSSDSNTTIIVLSDHGHGRRPLKILNINEILRRHGLLTAKSDIVTNIMERVKISAAKLVSRYNLGGAASKVMKLVPLSKKLYMQPLSIDWNSTLAYASDLSGIKAYTYGGIKIRGENLKGEEYEILRKKVINMISGVRNPENNDRIVKWIKKREALYSGKYLSKYPDILIQLREGYGIGQNVNSPLIGNMYTSSILPGSHKGDSPIFFIYNLDNEKNIRENITLMDVAPTVLDILGVKGEFGFDGESIFKHKDE